MEPVRSRQNRKVVEAARLLRVRDSGRTLLQGSKLLEEAAGAGVEIERVFHLPGHAPVRDQPGAEVVVVTDEVMKRLTPTGDQWGPVAVARLAPKMPRPGRPVLVAYELSDPGNLGTVIRSAAAFGYDVVAVHGADPWAPKTLRAGAGGHFHTHVSQSDDLPRRLLIAAVVEGGTKPDPTVIAADHALVIGSEANGLPEVVRRRAEHQVTIPMESGESLNAAAAAAILMYALRSEGPGPATASD